MASHDSLRIAENWFDHFSTALGSGDSVAVTSSFLPDGWFRDILVFGWDFRSLEGRAKIQNYLTEVLGKVGITNMQLDKSPSISPRPFSLTTTQPAGVELAFTFDLPYGACRGHARLLKDSDGEYRALTAMMSLSDLREHEETLTLPLRDDVTGIPGRDMQREYADWVHHVETDPFVLVGAYTDCFRGRVTLIYRILASRCCTNGPTGRRTLQAERSCYVGYRPSSSRRRQLAIQISHAHATHAEKTHYA